MGRRREVGKKGGREGGREGVREGGKEIVHTSIYLITLFFLISKKVILFFLKLLITSICLANE